MPPPDLSHLVAPGHTALVLQEAQRGVIGDESILPQLAEAARASGAVRNMGRLVEAGRRAGVSVVHCTAEHLPGGFATNHNARLFAGARRAGAAAAAAANPAGAGAAAAANPGDAGGRGGANEPGSSSVQPIPEVGPEPGDIVLPRYHGLSPMTGSPLDSLLRNQGVTTIVVAGVSLNLALPNLVFDGVNRSYQVVLVTDAVAGVPPDYGEQIIRHTLSLVATLATTDELISAWS